MILPMSGMVDAAGGMDSSNNNSKTKKATNMFIPGNQEATLVQRSNIQCLV